jgi:hypothetical protein
VPQKSQHERKDLTGILQKQNILFIIAKSRFLPALFLQSPKSSGKAKKAALADRQERFEKPI